VRFELQGVQFSLLPEGNLRIRDWDPGAAEVHINDTKTPQRDGVTPGRDWLGGNSWIYEITAKGSTLGEVLAANAQLAAAWRSVKHLAPTEKMPLRYQLDGRWRRVYGRPGRYNGVKVDTFAMNGNGHILSEFRVLDPLHYDDAEQVVRLNIVPATTGGLVGTLSGPLSSARSGAPRAGLVNNGGDAETPLKAVFHGPVRNPWVKLANGWEMSLSGSIAWDQTVTVDPLRGTVTRSDGAAVNGMLTHASQLSNSLLPPGPSELTFGGTDETGSSYVELMWRDAHQSI
jgi:hypothetical protein